MEHIEQLFAGHGFTFSFELCYAHFRGPIPEEWVEFMAQRYGPLYITSRALEPDRSTRLRHELIELAAATNIAVADGFDAPSEYLVAIARCRLGASPQ